MQLTTLLLALGALTLTPFLMAEAFAQGVTGSIPKTTFTDPEGRFSFLYPSDWELDAAENRFTKTSEATVSAPGNIIGWASVEVRLIEGTETSMDFFGLKDYVDIIVSRASSEIPNFRLLEDVNCEKYEIDGREACSVQYVRGTDSSFGSGLLGSESDTGSNLLASIMGEHAIEQVAFQVGDDTYLLMYGADFDNFDKYLPVAQEIFSTFKTSGSSEAQEQDEGNGDGGEENEQDNDEQDGGEDNTNIFN